MEEQIYYSNLYDYYKNLFTAKQQEYFENYFFDNLSLSEIGENYDVSRNAISKQIKEIKKNLDEYEEKLNLYKNSLEIKKIIKNIDEKTRKKIEELI